jgi:hypothetical protein
MSDITAKLIGTNPPADAGRDAIHVAVVPVIAAEILAPGQRVSLESDGRAVVDAEGVGVVDPFLRGYALAGERFWLFLPPGSITSLRHVWTHPAFAAEPSVVAEPPTAMPDNIVAARKWLEDFAPRVEMTYDELLAAAKDYLRSGEYVTEYGGQGWQDAFYENAETFWTHYETVTGEKVEDRGHFFSCSC